MRSALSIARRSSCRTSRTAIVCGRLCVCSSFCLFVCFSPHIAHGSVIASMCGIVTIPVWCGKGVPLRTTLPHWSLRVRAARGRRVRMEISIE